MSRHTVIQMPAVSPRNPLAMLAKQRKAGAHRASTGARRQQAQRELARELRHTDIHSP